MENLIFGLKATDEEELWTTIIKGERNSGLLAQQFCSGQYENNFHTKPLIQAFTFCIEMLLTSWSS